MREVFINVEVVSGGDLQGRERDDSHGGLDVANGASEAVLERIDDTAKFVYTKADIPHEALRVGTVLSGHWLLHVFDSAAEHLRVSHQTDVHVRAGSATRAAYCHSAFLCTMLKRVVSTLRQRLTVFTTA